MNWRMKSDLVKRKRVPGRFARRILCTSCYHRVDIGIGQRVDAIGKDNSRLRRSAKCGNSGEFHIFDYVTLPKGHRLRDGVSVAKSLISMPEILRSFQSLRMTLLLL